MPKLRSSSGASDLGGAWSRDVANSYFLLVMLRGKPEPSFPKRTEPRPEGIRVIANAQAYIARQFLFSRPNGQFAVALQIFDDAVGNPRVS